MKKLLLRSKKLLSGITTTKKILWLAWIFFSVLVYLKVKGYEVDTALEIVGGCVVTVISGFYMWKSKAENKVKISYGMIQKLANKYGIENVIALLQNILDD